MKSNEKNKHGRVVHINAHRNVAASTKGGSDRSIFPLWSVRMGSHVTQNLPFHAFNAEENKGSRGD